MMAILDALFNHSQSTMYLISTMQYRDTKDFHLKMMD